MKDKIIEISEEEIDAKEWIKGRGLPLTWDRLCDLMEQYHQAKSKEAKPMSEELWHNHTDCCADRNDGEIEQAMTFKGFKAAIKELNK